MKVSSTDFLNSLIMKPEQEALEDIRTDGFVARITQRDGKPILCIYRTVSISGFAATLFTDRHTAEYAPLVVFLPTGVARRCRPERWLRSGRARPARWRPYRARC
jgi:hypothetical protein